MISDGQSWRYFFLKILFPTFAAIALYIISIFAIIIPMVESNMMDDKRVMIQELTQSAWSILEDFERQVQQGNLTTAEAQKLAKHTLANLRYGPNKKDYFWVLNEQTTMIAHPYRPDLNGKDVSDFEDPHGKKLFAEFTQIVKQQGSGFVEYMWQWKDDPDKVVPKLSYVAGFKSWGWIVGTGIYIEDVKEDIAVLNRRLIEISIGIIFLTCLFLLLIILQTINIERKRQQAERDVIDSKDKYRALVEASTDGFIMLLDKKDMISNSTLISMLGYQESEFSLLTVFDIFHDDSDQEISSFLTFQKLIMGEPTPNQFDAQLVKKDGTLLDVLLTASHINFSGKDGIILIARDISEMKQIQRKRHDEEREAIITELQTTLHFLNQSIRGIMNNIVSCNMNDPIGKAAQLMSTKKISAVMIASETGRYIGMVTDQSIRERAVAKGLDFNHPVVEIMSAPIRMISDNALVFETAMEMQDKAIDHIAVHDGSGNITGIISSLDLLRIQGYSAVSLLQSIQRANTINEISLRRNKLPALVKAVVDSGAHATSITRIISTVSDTITAKLISFAIDELGEPPADFAFLALGSVGREEQTLHTDQDNGIVFAEPDDEQHKQVCDQYFLELGKRVCQWLNEVGYSFCKKDIMAQNPHWCQPLSIWKRYFTVWTEHLSAQELIEVDSCFDFRCIYGNRELGTELQQHIRTEMNRKPVFPYLLAENALSYKPPIGLFGNIVTKSSGEHQETFNIKSAMMPLVNIARAYALKHGIHETCTLDRIRDLNDRHILSRSDHAEIQMIYNFLMSLRLKHQSLEAERKEPIDNFINPKTLSNIELMTLKNVFSQINTFISKLGNDLKETRSSVS